MESPTAVLLQVAQILQIAIVALAIPILLRAYGPEILDWLRRRNPLRRTVRPTSAAPTTPKATVRQGQQDAPGEIAEGLRWLIVGASGQGKTYAARDMVRSYLRRGAEVIILDPDGQAWPAGTRQLGAPDDFEAIGAELASLAQRCTARRGAFMRGVRAFDPILAVVEEAPAVLRHAPGAIEALSDLARRGRKLGLHLLLLSQDTQARTLKLEGQLQLLTNFTRLDVRKGAGAIEILEAGKRLTAISLEPETDLEYPPVTPDADRLLGLLQHEWYPASEGGQKAAPAGPVGAAVSGSTPDTGAVSPGTTVVPAGTAGTTVGGAPIPPQRAVEEPRPRLSDDELIAELVARGVSGNQIVAVVGGNRNAVLGKVRALRGGRAERGEA